MTLKADYQYMANAIDLAKAQQGRTGRNPAVGCVIVASDGRFLADGVTANGGAEHAEQVALAKLPTGAAQGATAYVTLEPCRLRSAGGLSCSERLLDAGVVRVVCALADLHPNGSGGFTRLVLAGVLVEVGLMKAEAKELYTDFFSGL